MVVVADASPLIFLSRLGLLHLLSDLYGIVLVPRAAHSEVTADEEASGALAVRDADWIQVADPTENQPLQQAAQEELDAGEAAAIRLALERDADLLLIDERQGRRVARRLGLEIKGTLGILVASRREGLLEELRPILEKLIEVGAWVTEDLVRATLEAVGEADGGSD